MDLSQVSLFTGVSLNGLSTLAERGIPRTFPPGSVLMRQGGPSDCMYVIISGLVRVERLHTDITEPIILAELGPGETVGEMGLLDGEPRSATVVAAEHTETLELSATSLEETMLQFPEVMTSLLRTLSRRLRSTDQFVEDHARRRSAEKKGPGSR